MRVNIISVIGHFKRLNFIIARHVFRCHIPRMGKKPSAVVQSAYMSGLGGAKDNSSVQLGTWGRRSGRPASSDPKAIARLRKLL